MSWIKLDDQWMEHPKIIKAGRDARDIWLASITWCSKYNTDGYIPENLLPTLAVIAGVDVALCQSFARVLLDVCLWDATEDGYMVHDYLEYNPSKEYVSGVKAARKEAGRRGGEQKARNPSKTLANDLPKEVAKDYQNATPSPSPIPLIKDDDDETQASRNVIKVYEEEIGLITRDILEQMELAEKDYTSEWVIDAIKVASRNNARKWSYIDTVLRNWKRDGKDAKPPGWNYNKTNGNGNGGRKLDAFEAPPIPEDRIRYVDGKKEVLEKRYKTWAEYDAHLAKWRAELAEGDRIREAELKAEAEAKNERM